MTTGILRVHVVQAELYNHKGGIFHNMNPFVHIRVGQQVWNSAVAVQGGQHPRWVGQWMELATNMFQHQMSIQVKDAGHGIIGSANVPLSVFTVNGNREEIITLNTGGWIKMRSEFMGTGMGIMQPGVAVVTTSGAGYTTVTQPSALAFGNQVGAAVNGLLAPKVVYTTQPGQVYVQQQPSTVYV